MKIYLITGEPSGDILAWRLMEAIRRHQPHAAFAGVGGETMAAAGFESLFPMAELSVMGIWEVVPRLPLILRRVRQVVADIEKQQPDVIVTVDSWGFVSAVLKKLKKRGNKIPVVHYVAPQVWAWKKGRAKSVARLVDRLMTLWPYEAAWFEPYGLQCDFVGHPVIENTGFSTEKSNSQFSILNSQLILLPGSRHSEVKRLAPIFRNVAVRLQKDFPDLYIVIPSVEAMAQEIERAFAALPVPHVVIRGQQERYNAFRAARFAVAASGTVTLELAACGTPHLIAYRFSGLTNRLVKWFVKTPYANLINILAGRPVIPEFVLNNCRADRIYAKTRELMNDSAESQSQVSQAQYVLKQLKPSDAMPSEKAAAVVLSMVNG